MISKSRREKHTWQWGTNLLSQIQHISEFEREHCHSVCLWESADNSKNIKCSRYQKPGKPPDVAKGSVSIFKTHCNYANQIMWVTLQRMETSTTLTVFIQNVQSEFWTVSLSQVSQPPIPSNRQNTACEWQTCPCTDRTGFSVRRW